MACSTIPKEDRMPNQVTGSFGKSQNFDANSFVNFVRSDFNKKDISLDQYIQNEIKNVSINTDEYLVFVRVNSHTIASYTGILFVDGIGKNIANKEFERNSLSILKINKKLIPTQKINFINTHNFRFYNERLGRMTSDSLVEIAKKDYINKAKDIVQIKVFDSNGQEVFLSEEPEQAKIREETLMEETVLGWMTRVRSIGQK